MKRGAARDTQRNRLEYSRGFSSIYGEWETTAEAKESARTFSESLRFPAPAAPVQVLLKKREPRTNAFREVWSLLVDPKGMFVDDAAPPPAGPLIALQKKGDPATHVDLLILGDGYTAQQRGKFESDARRLVNAQTYGGGGIFNLYSTNMKTASRRGGARSAPIAARRRRWTRFSMKRKPTRAERLLTALRERRGAHLERSHARPASPRPPREGASL